MAKAKERIDKLLFERGLVETRSKSQAIIMAGEVLVEGEPVTKAGQKVPVDAHIEIVAPAPFVSRGGYKLSEALERFDIDVSGQVCADVGACTGGFTDVLLQRNASRVYAIDVGYGQLAWNLRNDARVRVMERTNVRYLGSLAEQVSFIAIDVSFISLKLVLPTVSAWLENQGDIVSLIKPQFEAGREKVGKGGIVRDPEVHRLVLSNILNWSKQRDFGPYDLIRSPITGSGGNIEFLLHLRPGRSESAVIDELIDKVIPGETIS